MMKQWLSFKSFVSLGTHTFARPVSMARLLLMAPANKFPMDSKSQTLSLLETCSGMEELKQIHAQMFKTGLVLDTIPISRLLSFCATRDSGDLSYAHLVFQGIQRPNTFMWNAMVRGYSNNNGHEEALLMYHHMLHSSVPPNDYTFPFLLKACAALSALEETQQIHAQILKTGFGFQAHATNALLHVYAKSGSLKSARLLFDRLTQQDTVSWNSMVDGYAKSGDMETARELFNQMPAKNVVSWTSIISACVCAGLSKEALHLFHQMQNVGVEPDNVVLASILSACAHLGALDQGRWIHAYIDKKGIQIDPVLGCTLMDMYSKCGDVEEALSVFRNIENRGVPTWTAIIAGLAIHGRGREAIDIFVEMKRAGIKPNAITFTGALTACSHAGLVDEGILIFNSMDESPSIEHYGCMVDLLGRAGMLKEAEELVMTMPMRPNAAIWGALLKACHIHRNFELGKRIGKILLEVDPGHGGRYIHLANIFATTGEWDQAVKLRRMMKDRGVMKLPGCSSISLSGVVHEFLAGDLSHPKEKEIYLMWGRIAERLRQEGYVTATRDSLLDLEEEEKETAIHQHSEKLAIAFGFISTKPGTVIRITKNLRACEDCHTAAKLISKIYSREIVMRDRIRFHLFSDGNCSCKDYW